MKITHSGTVVASRPNTDMGSCCFPSVAVLETGRWLASCRAAPGKSSRTERVVLMKSDDQGATWSTPREPFKTVPEINGRAGQWRAFNLTPLGGKRVLGTLSWEDYSDPFRPMYNPETEGIVDMRMYTTVSDDAGETWSSPLPITFGQYDDVPNAITGPTLLTPSAGWAAQFEVNKHYDDSTPWQHHSSLVFSKDNGKTWEKTAVDTHTDPAKRVFCWDQRLAVMRDGSIQGLYWTFDRKDAAYLNIHAAVSKDSGKTWTPVWDTGVAGQPARPVHLKDGRLLMVFVDRSGQPTIKARISTDGAKSFSPSTEIEVHKRDIKTQTVKKGDMSDAWAEMGAFSVGLPDATLLPDGDVLAVFYTGPKSDQTDIEWVRIRP